MKAAFGIALFYAVTCAAFAQRANRTQEGSDAPLVWEPASVLHLDVFPKATVPKPMITKLHVSDWNIVLEETELEVVRAHLGGEIGSHGDASESLGWLCLYGSDEAGRWVLWLESGEIDGGSVGSFLWRRVGPNTRFDKRCRMLPKVGSRIKLPIPIRLGTTETKALQILGRPTARHRHALVYVHEHEESIHNEPYTSTNTVVVEFRRGLVWAIEVHQTNQS
jgi:hypothetical protein